MPKMWDFAKIYTSTPNLDVFEIYADDLSIRCPDIHEIDEWCFNIFISYCNCYYLPLSLLSLSLFSLSLFSPTPRTKHPRPHWCDSNGIDRCTSKQQTYQNRSKKSSCSKEMFRMRNQICLFLLQWTSPQSHFHWDTKTRRSYHCSPCWSCTPRGTQSNELLIVDKRKPWTMKHISRQKHTWTPRKNTVLALLLTVEVVSPSDGSGGCKC